MSTAGEQLELRPFEVGMRGSDRAGRRWTSEQVRAVDDAIEWCANVTLSFTADAVWARLKVSAPDLPVTKGLAGRLNRARNRGLIRSTGRFAIAKRGGLHDHAQRLSVWERAA